MIDNICYFLKIFWFGINLSNLVRVFQYRMYTILLYDHIGHCHYMEGSHQDRTGTLENPEVLHKLVGILTSSHQVTFIRMIVEDLELE